MDTGYYNTTNQTGRTLSHLKAKADTQEVIILGYFECNPDACMNPFEIQDLLFGKLVPITSIRRAVTNLTNEGRLEKTDIMREGKYGRTCFCWRLA